MNNFVTLAVTVLVLACSSEIRAFSLCGEEHVKRL